VKVVEALTGEGCTSSPEFRLRQAMDIEDLYKRYGPMVLRRCLKLLKSKREAEDAAQEVFVQVIQRRAKLTPDYPSSLLYRIATNICLNRIRSRLRGREEGADEELLHRIAVIPDWDSGLILDKLFGRHPASSRVMAVMHFLDGMTLEQVAGEFGMSVSGVRKRLRSLRKSLRELENL
jgi:RNA polymerase sigma-70 factor, ECF subfamily